MGNLKPQVSHSKSGREIFVTWPKKAGGSTTVVFVTGRPSGDPKVLRKKS